MHYTISSSWYYIYSFLLVFRRDSCYEILCTARDGSATSLLRSSQRVECSKARAPTSISDQHRGSVCSALVSCTWTCRERKSDIFTVFWAPHSRTQNNSVSNRISSGRRPVLFAQVRWITVNSCHCTLGNSFIYFRLNFHFDRKLLLFNDRG